MFFFFPTLPLIFKSPCLALNGGSDLTGRVFGKTFSATALAVR